MSSEREKAIEAFQTKEFIDFALSSAQTAQEISNKEEELRAEEEMLNHEKNIIMENVEELKRIRSQLETQHRNVSLAVAQEAAARSVCVCVREGGREGGRERGREGRRESVFTCVSRMRRSHRV